MVESSVNEILLPHRYDKETRVLSTQEWVAIAPISRNNRLGVVPFSRPFFEYIPFS